MVRNLGKLFGDEAGFVISAELVLVLTIAVLAMVVIVTLLLPFIYITFLK